MEVFVEHLGLTPLQAIQCATENGALCLRLKDKVGTIQKNRLADLLVVKGDPSKDVTLLGQREQLHAVMANGNFIDLQRKDPVRSNIPEWRCHDFGEILTKEIVAQARQNKK